jgi:restriction system protein
LLELLRHYQEQQIDSQNALRRVWVLEFRIHNEVDVVPIAIARELTTAFLADRESRPPEEREVVTPEAPSAIIEGAVSYETEQLRSHLFQINPYRFESLVKDVIERRGFERVSVTRGSQDGGIDLNAYVSESDYFFSRTHVQFQVKRWRHSVGSVDINGFRGALSSTAKGVFITTSHFTRVAMREAEHPTKPVISLIDGLGFSRLVGELAIEPKDYK